MKYFMIILSAIISFKFVEGDDYVIYNGECDRKMVSATGGPRAFINSENEIDNTTPNKPSNLDFCF